MSNKYINIDKANAALSILVNEPQYRHIRDNWFDGVNAASKAISNIPFENDLVEVVRCKNCAYANDDGTICRYGVGRDTKPDKFCADGEMKAKL